MDFGMFLGERLKMQEKKGFSPDDGYLLRGLEQLYGATGDTVYKEFLFNYAGRFDWENTFFTWKKTKRFQMGKSLFFLYRETGEEKYRALAEQLKKELVCDFSDTKEMYEVLPFYMEYETRFHNKAEYGDIVRCFAEGEPQDGAHWYLMALADAMEHMSIEIFEHYKSLQEIFKKTIKSIVPDEGKTVRNVCIGYAVAKACSMGLLNPEKYSETGRKLMDGAIESPHLWDGDTELGILMMARAALARSVPF